MSDDLTVSPPPRSTSVSSPRWRNVSSSPLRVMSSVVGRSGSWRPGHSHGQVEAGLGRSILERLIVQSVVDEERGRDPEEGGGDRHDQDEGAGQSRADASRPVHAATVRPCSPPRGP